MNQSKHEEAVMATSVRRFAVRWAVIGLAAAVITFGIVGLLVNIFQRRQEARNPFFRVVDLSDETVDPAIWGRNFPLQYDTYSRTVDMARTRFGGSEAMVRTPTAGDPRTVVTQSKLEADPRLVRMWAGYPFSVDYREERGHAYMLEDQTFTGRHEAAPQPGACLHCHSSVYAAYRKAGDGDLFRGFEMLNPLPYEEARQHVEHPISCIDCHHPETMQLRITRPAFIEGIRRVKATQGVDNYDVNRMSTRQEMRTYVCAQCHVEYYFKGADKRLTYPWDRGVRADEILAYYEQIGFADWTHEMTGARLLKAQHPEFELWSQGIHARAGVACADCHMPYVRVGAMKISDHHVRSPLLNVNHACQTCHNVAEEELKVRAERIQERTLSMRDRTMDALMELIDDIRAAQEQDILPERLEIARDLQRKGQFLLDFVESENSLGFHADQEAARVLNLALDHIRRGQLSLR